eukprot:1997543-Alexandrium_andersonii.AAC.1
MCEGGPRNIINLLAAAFGFAEVLAVCYHLRTPPPIAAALRLTSLPARLRSTVAAATAPALTRWRAQKLRVQPARA